MKKGIAEIIKQLGAFLKMIQKLKEYGNGKQICQFFKIEELNWSGKKVVDSWRYYRNGDFIQETDEELCKKLMVSEYSSKVQWQG